MKRKVIILLLALFAFTAAQAQQISVVSTSGSTHLYSTLQEAIEGASSGSVIYIPGGGFPISDEVKITKKVTIIGIGHKTRNENVDGNTIIGGNLFFNQGSDGSAVMGCYITGNVTIGEDGKVDNVLIKLCNLNNIIITTECKGTIVNQNYVRTTVWGCAPDEYNPGATDVTISNNIIGGINGIGSGIIKNNILIGNQHTLYNVRRSIINNNIFRYNYTHLIIDCQAINNYVTKVGSPSGDGGSPMGDDPVLIDADPNEVFKNLNNWEVNPMSNFHFTDTYSQYESQVGIYAGTGFSDSQLPPTPYIVGKIIPDNTDAAGKLNIRVRVKASSNE